MARAGSTPDLGPMGGGSLDESEGGPPPEPVYCIEVMGWVGDGKGNGKGSVG